MSKRVFCVLFALLLVAGVNSVQGQPQEIEKIVVTLATGLSAAFTEAEPDADSTLTWTGNDIDIVLYGDGGSEWYPDSTTLSASWTNMVDNSGSARFTAGTWSLVSTDGGSEVLNLSGTLAWYTEDPTGDNSAFGRGVFNVAPGYSVDVGYFGGAQWGFNPAYPNQSGVDATTSGITVLPPETLPYSYQEDWTGPNLTLLIWADPTQIPEPATLGLLGLGGVLMVLGRRRRHAA
ncbi:MAG: PEP-CTERM sorting domain-containing protein [Sedimentisphaerales bacterium]|nr:PEP-CTERM sorting domain-containing protein [Sedimentisphaerales bacterium]